MADIHIDHADRVEAEDETPELAVLQQILGILQDMQARLASLADHQTGGTP